MRRLSIRRLMAFIIVAAIGLAALRNANDLWAGMLLLFALAAVGAAVMGAVILRGKERYWSAGFAFFAACYLALAIGPWPNSWSRSRIGTTHLLDQLRVRMSASDADALSASQAASLLLEEQGLEAELAQVRRVARNPTDPAVLSVTKRLQAVQMKLTANQNAGPRPEEFQEVGHALFGLVAGVVGGTVAVWLCVRRETGGRGAAPHRPGL